MERELVALRGIIKRVGAAPRVIADVGVQLVLPATPNAVDGARALYGTRTKHFVMSADAGARPDVAFIQLNGLEAPAALMLLWLAPFPPFESTR
jgi:hypothetical protein